MGMRYRKSVKICKGVKVNLSKSGASLSLGGPGHSVNFGKRGTRTTVGIPGTGLSYSKLYGNSNSSKSKQVRKNSPSLQEGQQIRISIDEKKHIRFFDMSDTEITDPSLIRKIKSTETYKNNVDNLYKMADEKIDKMVEISQKETDKFINIVQYSCHVNNMNEYEQKISNLKPQTYVIVPYSILQPSKEDIQIKLEKEAKDKVHANFFSVHKLRKKYVEEHFADAYDESMKKWNADKLEYLKNESIKKTDKDKQFYNDFLEKKEYLEECKKGNANIVCSVFDSWIANMELPMEININYEWDTDHQTMGLDVDLPEIEDLPETIKIKTDSGNLKEKKKTQTELRQEYAKMVFGLAVFIGSHVFDISPAIKRILISGYTQRRNKIGDLVDCYIYSLILNRGVFEKTDLKYVEPLSFCMQFNNRCNMTKTQLFKEIKPFEMKDCYE